MPAGQSCDVERTDEQLLDRFVSQGDAAAFEMLVRRHGPMVLGVCRRLLHHPQDAEDAFQATFLVLVRKAASLGQREFLGNWLYGVAYRTALDARAAAMRRRKREKQVSSMPEPEIRDDSEDWRDLRPFLDQELNRLPDKYRIPIVLCDLEGRTRRDAAEQLAIPVGTLSGRLTTAREMLAKRLTRRGLVLSGTAMIAALSPSAASAAVPSPLVASTVQAGTAIAAGQAGAAVVSVPVTALAEGVVKAMLVKKLKIATAVLLTVVVVGAAAVMVSANREATGAAKILELDGGGVRVAWSPDGKTLAVAERYERFFPASSLHNFFRRGCAIKLWDVQKGQVRQTLAESPERGALFQPVAFSADGKTIAAAINESKEVIRQDGRHSIQSRAVVRIWDAKTLALKHTLEGGSQLDDLALSPDGKWLAGANPNKKTIRIWDSHAGKLERTLETGEAQPYSLAFSPQSKLLAVGGQKEDHSGQVQVWDVPTWKQKHVLKQDTIALSVAFSANGKILASGDSFVHLWDAEKGERIRSLKGVHPGTYCVAFSPDCQTIAAGWKDGKVRLWDVQTGALKETLEGHATLFGQIFSLAFSPDGKMLASASQDGTVCLWPINQPAAGRK
jgi:RNA polymerase sigma factor (sigma-70 family)